jgi:L-fuconolactonase
MIDAHVHFWRPARGDYGWLTPDLTGLHRDVLPDELRPIAAAAGVESVIAVQAAPTEDETRYLLDLARADPLIAGVVGWVDLVASDVGERLAALVGEGAGLLKGVRPMLQDLDDPAWVAQAELDAGFAAVLEHDLTFDALVRMQHLPALAERLRRTPGLRTVIDHGAKPGIAANDFDTWRAALAPFAELPNVACKLSGLLTENDGGQPEEVDRYALTLADLFGPDRLIWGSDWPVLTTVTDYAAWLEHARRLVPDPRVFEDNARRIYRIGAERALLLIAPADNVATTLRPLVAGETVGTLRIVVDVPFGFKVAVAPIAAGAPVLKYGVPIGSATRAILPGERVHLENMRSDYTVTHLRGDAA